MLTCNHGFKLIWPIDVTSTIIKQERNIAAPCMPIALTMILSVSYSQPKSQSSHLNMNRVRPERGREGRSEGGMKSMCIYM